MYFSLLTRRIPQSDAIASVEDFDKVRAENTPQQGVQALKNKWFLQSSELGSLTFGLRREKLTVPALRRFPLLAEDQTPGVQTIPSGREML